MNLGLNRYFLTKPKNELRLQINHSIGGAVKTEIEIYKLAKTTITMVRLIS